MKKITFPLLMLGAGIICTSLLKAQSTSPVQTLPNANGIVRCGEAQYENYLRSQDPNFDLKRAEVMKTVQESTKKIIDGKKSGNPQPMTQYTLPIVYHVVWNTAAQNVSDAQVNAMHAQLNMDWARTNTDAGNTPAPWQSIASAMDIQFCLATKDPSGNATTGIVHKQTSTTSFSTNDNMKYTAQGGDDAWDVNKYLNIWICNLGGGLLGFANFPPVASNYGTVIHYITVGSLTMPNAAGGAFGYGRTLSHEIGHNFTFNHIWDGGCPAMGDGIADTPGQSGPTSGCPTFPALDGCQTASPGFMYCNYMDYTDDLCYNMFTAGQKAVAQSTTANYLMGLQNASSTVCNVAPPPAIDAGINSIISPNGIVCNTTFAPIVKLMNYGASALTAATINYKIDNNPNQTYSWTGNLASAASTNVTLPNMTTTAGTHTFTSSTTVASDGNPGNDGSTSAFTTAGAAQTPPVQEPFANASPFPPGTWTINNPDALTTWAYNAANYPTSSGGSMFMDYFNYTAQGQKDEFISSPLNFAAATSAQMTFEVAYQLFTDPATSPNFSDTLQVLTSSDCGVTWNSAYKKYGASGPNQLTTVTPEFSANAFVPAAAGDWRLETVSLPLAPSVLVKITGIGNYENQMYVDDINITAVVGVSETTLDNYFSVYPNPSNGTVNIYLSSAELGNADVKITNLLGEVISETSINTSAQRKISFNLENSSNGIYFVNVKTNSGSATKKVMVSK